MSVIPKKPAPDLIRGGNRLSEKDQAQTQRITCNEFEESAMWYFTWILGVGFAIAFGILNAMWFELHSDRTDDRRP